MIGEDLKFYLAQQMQSFAGFLLTTLLDKRFHTDPTNRLNESSINLKCRDELILLSSSALKNEHWALKVFDSNGRLQSGIASGSLFNSLGNYEQCLNVEAGSLISHTKYCLAHVNAALEANQLSQLTHHPKTVFSLRQANLGLCVPGVCEASDVIHLGNRLIQGSISTSLFIQDVDCSPVSESSTGTAAWAPGIPLMALIFIVFTIGACTSATILDCQSMYENKRLRRYRWLIRMFSLRQAFKRLMLKRQHGRGAVKENQVDLRALNGLRVLSMVWIIAIHSYNFALQWLNFDNIQKVVDVYKGTWIQWIANGTFSVDNFFLVAGFLARFNYISQSYSGAKRKVSKESANSEQSMDFNDHISMRYSIRYNFSDLAKNCFDRYLRLMPNMMLMIFFSVALLPCLAYGPNWARATTMFDQWCHTNWYINMLMVHNLIGTPNMCFSHSWYVAVDFQLFILLQLIIWLSTVSWRLSEPKITSTRPTKLVFAWTLYLIIVAAQILVAALIHLNSLPSIPLIPTDTIDSMIKYYSLVYIKPYYWIASYLLGVLLADCVTLSSQSGGYLSSSMRLRRRQTSERPQALSSWQVSLIMCGAASLMICLLLSSLNYFKHDEEQMSRTEATIYALIARPLWSLSIGCILYFSLLHTRYISNGNLVAEMIQKTLCSNIWLPLSRLNYSAYLLHPVIMAMFYGSRTETFQFSNLLLLYFALGNTVLTYTSALVVYLFIEFPIQATIRRLKLIPCLRSKAAARATTACELASTSTSRSNDYQRK